MSAYYNEHDPKAAAWLRELIAAGHIAPGEVDERSITDVRADELAAFTQCHFFAGIGGWSYALRMAGWPDDLPVWTGSCPCQPFSAAGKGLGTADERHLWPVFRELIRAAKPATVFGEQVASKAGRDWLAGVFADLEGMAYQRAGADLCAAGVGAPHIRQRLFWVANAIGQRCSREWLLLREESGGRLEASILKASGGCTADRLEHSEGDGRQQRGSEPIRGSTTCGCGELRPRQGNISRGGLADATNNGCERGQGAAEPNRRAGATSGSRMGNANEQRCEGKPFGLLGASNQRHWRDSELIPCRDGKARRIEPGTFPLAHGIPGRVGLLRGYGNAIVPQVAAEFIAACIEALAVHSPTHETAEIFGRGTTCCGVSDGLPVE